MVTTGRGIMMRTNRNFLEKYFLENNSMEILSEIKELKTDLYRNKYQKSGLASLKSKVENFLNVKFGGFLTSKMLKIMYIVYVNSENKYKNLNYLMYRSGKDGFEKNILCGVMNKRGAGGEIESKHGKWVWIVPYLLEIDTENVKIKKAQEECERIVDGEGIARAFNRFVVQYQSNSALCVKREGSEDEDSVAVHLTTELSGFLVEEFVKLDAPKIPVVSGSLDEEEEEIEGVKYAEDFAKERDVERLVMEENNIDRKRLGDFLEENSGVNYYIPDNEIKFHSLCSLINKERTNNFKFLLNPMIRVTDFDFNCVANIPMKLVVKVLDKEYFDANSYDSIVSKYSYVCPKCQKYVELIPVEMGEKVVHMCSLGEVNTKTTINNKVIIPKTTKLLMLYKCSVKNRDGSWIDNVYLHSFDYGLEPGVYVIDVVKFYDKFNLINDSDNYRYFYLMLGAVKKKVESDTRYIVKTNKKAELEKELPGLVEFYETHKKIPEHKVFNVIYSIRKYYRDEYDIRINNTGMVLQIFLVVSMIARHLFKFKKFGINIVGTGSVSKSYPAKIYGNILDINYQYISDTARLSPPAMTGGINSSVKFNGSSIKKLEKGKITNDGMTVFDECQSIFLKPEFQSIIKSFPEDVYDIAVIGGQLVPYNTTPVFLSNFNPYSQEYEKIVRDAFTTKYKSANRYENDRKLKTNQDIIAYISKVNLYENIEYYHDELEDKILSNVVYSVRKRLENNRIDWRTGAQLEAMNRILLDTVIYQKQTTKTPYKKKIEMSDEEMEREIENFDSTTIAKDKLPIEEIRNELIQYIYNKKDTYRLDMINVKEINKNTNERKTQLRSLEKSIHKFLNTENLGVNIYNNFIMGTSKMDKKVEENIYRFITVLQLIDDINSTEIKDNVKKLSNILLLKCKRGISIEEYNMDKNLTEIKMFDDLDENFISDIDDIKTELYISEKIEKEKRLKEQEEKQQSNIENLENIDTTKDTEHSFDEIKEKYCPHLDQEETKKYIHKLEKDGIIYQPRTDIYKIRDNRAPI